MSDKNISRNKKPSQISVLIFFSLLIINRYQIESLEGTFEQIRFYNQTYNWDIYIPIFYLLLVFSLIELWKVRKDLKANLFSLLFLMPIVFYQIYFVIKILSVFL